MSFPFKANKGKKKDLSAHFAAEEPYVFQLFTANTRQLGFILAKGHIIRKGVCVKTEEWGSL